MRPHPRIRKAIKWGGTVFSIALALLTWVSVGYVTKCERTVATRTRTLTVSKGEIVYDSSPFSVGYSSSTPKTVWTFREKPHQPLRWWFRSSPVLNGTIIGAPLWIPLLLVITPTALAWRLDTFAARRTKLNACPTCSYSRAGLAPSSPCPECGAATPQA